MRTLVELLSDMERLSGREAVVYDDGFRTRRWTYGELLRHVAGVAEELEAIELSPGDRILLWGENRPEWLAVFWAALARRLTVVPVDFRSSAAFVSRVQQKVEAKLLVHGASVDAAGLEIRRIDFETVSRMESERRLSAETADPDDVVQVIYTSGTTGEPKGIVHRHHHLTANLLPIRREIEKYRTLARPFQPVRFLDLLPLSHVFGQFTGLYIPVLMGGSVVFLREVHPGAIIDTIRDERVSVLVSVPRFLEALRNRIERRFDVERRPRIEAKGLWGGLRRYARHLDVHRAFGLKFWAILSGGARLPAEQEEFWYRLGFVLVQGYGLTETSSLVTTNHPFHPTPGSLGRAVGNQEIRLAPDGEILVRGENVSLEVFGEDGARRGEGEEVWLHTGDVGEFGPDGTLYYKGRKKDVIVGPEGLNVYPGDVESVLARNPAVKEAVVVGRDTERGEAVHAVLLLGEPEADPSAIVEAANRELEHHQRVREWTVWPEEDFPRTPSTFKVRRHEVERAISGREDVEPEARPAEGATAVRDLLARRLGRRPEDLRPSHLLAEDLGLSSIDRVELLASLEEHYGRELSETAMASAGSIAELEQLVESAEEGPETRRETRPEARFDTRKVEPEPRPERSPLSGIVRFARTPPIRAARWLFRESVILTLFRRYLPMTVEGSLEGVEPPVLFAPNHTSNLDTIALLAALPREHRDRLAPAISQDYFLPYLERKGGFRERLSLGAQFWLAALTMNVYPLPQSTRGVRRALQFAGELVDSGYSLLVFPEGIRTPDGRMREFRPGVGLMAVRLQIPVVPVHIQGLYEVMPVQASWPRPGPVRLRFGEPLTFGENEDYREVARRIEEAVRRLGQDQESNARA